MNSENESDNSNFYNYIYNDQLNLMENKNGKGKQHLMTIYDYIDEVFDKLRFGKAMLK